MKFKRGSLRGPGWPSREQELLLRVGLMQGEIVLRSWEMWKSNSDIDHLDSGSFRLLNLAYRNLLAHHSRDPLMDRLKIIYWQTWFTNQNNLIAVAKVLAAFSAAAIPTVVLKGVPLAMLCYKDLGARPMYDFDFLVPIEKVLHAVRLLEKIGWRSNRKLANFTATYLSVRPSHNFLGTDQIAADLHWRLLSENEASRSDDDFWNGSQPFDVHGAPTRILNPTDQLLHTFLHGVQWNPASSVRWVADAAMILRTSEIDWDRLLLQAVNRRIVVPVREALTYIHDLLDVAIPSAVLAKISTFPVSTLEAMEFKMRLLPGGMSLNWFHYLLYSPLARNVGLPRKMIRFPIYVQHTLDLEKIWKIPLIKLLQAWSRREQ